MQYQKLFCLFPGEAKQKHFSLLNYFLFIFKLSLLKISNIFRWSIRLSLKTTLKGLLEHLGGNLNELLALL